MRSNRLLPRVRNALLLFVLLLSAGTMPVNAREAAANQRGSAATTIQQNDSSAFTFTLHTPSAQVANGMVLVPGLETTTNTSGAPQLPYYSTYIALPPGASFELSVSSSSVSSVAVGEIRPAPEHALRKAGTDLFPADALEQRSGYEEAVAYVRDATIYAANAFYPDNNYLLGEEFLAGGFRVVKLDLFPVRYNPLQNRLQQAQEMTVAITFSGAEPMESEAEPSAVQLNAFWRDNMLNQPPASWRSTAQDTMADAPALPIGEDTFKIAVTQDGIQEISGSALAAAGMNLAGVDPATIEMMHRGMPVAYQFLNNDGQPGFGATDAIRFFGWAFDGSRYEDMYVSDNIFWLWADGAAMPIATVANEAGSGYAKVTSFQESLTEWPHVYFFEGWSVDWDESPNEATPWHWNLIAPAAGAAQLRRLSLDLPNPATASAETATVVVEFTTRLNTLKQTSATYDVSVALNKSDAVNATWEDSANVN
ncbi:MAG: C25 family peptidase propeptide domain-containing protein, partial [Candidatus Promineifilaceae bacterium]